jgi:hypothetical protein
MSEIPALSTASFAAIIPNKEVLVALLSSFS